MEQRFDIQPADVFISFTGADRAIKNRIIEYLESKNIKCLESDEECCGNYIEWSEESPGHCSLFLPIITKNVKSTSIIKDEFESIKKQDDCYNRIIPVSTDLETYEKHSFGMSQWCSAVLAPLSEEISYSLLEELYSKIKKLLIHMWCRQRFSPGMASRYFLGRDAELKEIHQKLEKFNNVFITGIGGMGKTELAKKYVECRNENNSFFNVIYLRFDKDFAGEETSALKGMIDDIMEKMPVADECEVFNNPQTLVVLDNFDVESDEYLDEFLSFNCKKIITTRNKRFADYENADTVFVGVLADTEQRELFCSHYGYEVEDDDKYLEFILKTVAGLTVFIPIIAKQCKVSRVGMEEICQKLISGGIPEFATAEEFQLYKDDVLLKGNTLRFSRVIFEIAELNTTEKEVLRCLSLLQFMCVNASVYKEICSGKSFSVLNGLIDKNWIIENKTGKSAKDNLFELHPVINELVRTDLKPSPENSGQVFEYVRTSLKETGDSWKNHLDYIKNTFKFNIKLSFVYNLDWSVPSNLGFVLNLMKPDVTLNPMGRFCRNVSSAVRGFFEKSGYNRDTFKILKVIFEEGYIKSISGVSIYLRGFRKIACENKVIDFNEFKDFCFDIAEQTSYPSLIRILRVEEYKSLFGTEWEKLIDLKKEEWEKKREAVKLKHQEADKEKIIPEYVDCTKLLNKWEQRILESDVCDAVELIINELLKEYILDKYNKIYIMERFIGRCVSGNELNESHMPYMIRLFKVYCDYEKYCFADECIIALSWLFLKEKSRISEYFLIRKEHSIEWYKNMTSRNRKEIENLFKEFEQIVMVARDIFSMPEIRLNVAETLWEIAKEYEKVNEVSSEQVEILMSCYDYLRWITKTDGSGNERLSKMYAESVKKLTEFLNLPVIKNQ